MECNQLGFLITRQMLPAEIDELHLGGFHSRFENDRCRHRFAPLFVGHTENRCFHNRRMHVKNLFDLIWIDIQPARDNHFAFPVYQVKIPIVIQAADIPGVKPTVFEGFRRYFGRLIPISLHHVIPPHNHLPQLSDGNIIAAVIGGCLLTGGHGSAVGAALGAVIFGMVRVGIVFAGWDTDWFFSFLGVMLLVAVLVNNFTRHRAESVGVVAVSSMAEGDGEVAI